MGSWVLGSRTEGALKGFGVRDLNFCSSNYYLCESGQVIQLQGWDDKTRTGMFLKLGLRMHSLGGRIFFPFNGFPHYLVVGWPGFFFFFPDLVHFGQYAIF